MAASRTRGGAWGEEGRIVSVAQLPDAAAIGEAEALPTASYPPLQQCQQPPVLMRRPSRGRWRDLLPLFVTEAAAPSADPTSLGRVAWLGTPYRALPPPLSLRL